MDRDNLVLACMGDSTTWGDDGISGPGDGPEISWPRRVGELLGFSEVLNYGVCGACCVAEPGHDRGVIQRYGTIDPRANVITLMIGVNDFRLNVPLGELAPVTAPQEADPTTFCGALDIVVRGIVSAHPGAMLVLMTPMKTSRSANGRPTSFERNGLGLTQESYVRAVRSVADRYSLPVIDLYASSGISPFVPEHRRYMPDGLHYSPEGYERLARRIAGELRVICGL